MKCPKCAKVLREDSVYHKSCGWSAASHPDVPEDYQRCEWTHLGKPCRYPGSISSSNTGTGPWYCHLHYGCDDARAGADVVDASQDYQHAIATDGQAQADREASAWLESQGLGPAQGESLEEYGSRMRQEARARFKGIGKGGAGWAERIAQDAAQVGKRYPSISLEIARAVLAARI